MKASKDWGACGCNCGTLIRQDDEIVVYEGILYLNGHQNKATRQIAAVGAKADPPKKKKRK